MVNALKCLLKFFFKIVLEMMSCVILFVTSNALFVLIVI